MRRFINVAAAAMAALVVSPPPTPNQPGTISGRVVDVKAGEPVAGASVAYSTDGNRSKVWGAETDAEGRFLLEGVPAGSIYVSASKPGYIDGSYGQRLLSGPGRGVDLADDEHARGIEVPLWQEASVFGRILDDNGRPIVGVPVHVLHLEIRGGHRQLVTGKSAVTNAAGRYEVTRIAPGTYAVAVMSGSATFYPSARTAAGASLITLESGDEREIDVSVGSVAFRVSGVVPDIPVHAFGPEVRPSVELRPSSMAIPSTNLGGARAGVAQDGRYVFSKVPPGEYLVRVVVVPRIVVPPGFVSPPEKLPAGETRTLVATTSITVDDRDLNDIVLRLRPGARISGHVVFDGDAPRPTAEELLGSPVTVRAVDGLPLAGLQSARVEADGRFVTDGLPPGRYAVAIRLGRNDRLGRWTSAWPVQLVTWAGTGLPVGAIEVGDTDVTGITITLSDRAAELTGVVRDRDGKTRSEVTIYLLPSVQDLWIGDAVRQTRSGRNGHYTIPSLPAGEYLIVAAVDEPPELWRDVEYLAMLAGSGSRVVVARGQTKTVDLTVR